MALIFRWVKIKNPRDFYIPRIQNGNETLLIYMDPINIFISKLIYHFQQIKAI